MTTVFIKDYPWVYQISWLISWMMIRPYAGPYRGC